MLENVYLLAQLCFFNFLQVVDAVMNGAGSYCKSVIASNLQAESSFQTHSSRAHSAKRKKSFGFMIRHLSMTNIASLLEKDQKEEECPC